MDDSGSARLTFLQQIDSTRDWSSEISKTKTNLLNVAKAISVSQPTLGVMTSTFPPAIFSKSQRRKAKKKLKRNTIVSTINTKDVLTVIFDDPAKTGGEKKHRKDQDGNTGSKRTAEKEPELDLKKTKYEIIKLGFNSMKGQSKEDAETAFAISLGAKPPKKSFINYKDLQEMKKQEKIRQAEEEAGRAKQPRFTLKKGDRLKNRSQSQKTKSSMKGKNKIKASASNSNVKQNRRTNNKK